MNLPSLKSAYNIVCSRYARTQKYTFSMEMKIEELEGDMKAESDAEVTTKKTTISKIT